LFKHQGLERKKRTRGFVEAEVFKKLGLFEVIGVLRRSNKCASLDGVVPGVYRGHAQLMVPRVLWRSEITF
jgi:hypothetical protein